MNPIEPSSLHRSNLVIIGAIGKRLVSAIDLVAVTKSVCTPTSWLASICHPVATSLAVANVLKAQTSKLNDVVNVANVNSIC